MDQTAFETPTLIEISPQMRTSPKELQSMILAAHSNFLIDKAYELVQIYRECNRAEPAVFDMGDLRNQQMFNEIEAFHQEMRFLLEQLQDNKDWIQESITNDATLSYKFIPNTPTISLKWEEVLHVPIVNACALIYQTDLFNQWIPFCKVSRTVKQINKAHKVAYLLLQLPIINNREALVRGYGIDRLDIDDSFLLCCKSIQKDIEYQKKYDITVEQGKNVHLDLKFFTIQITIINRHSFLLKCVCNVDPQLTYVPKAMINYFTRKVARFIFQKFINIAKNIKGTVYEQAMELDENKEFYEWINGRFDEYFTQRVEGTALHQITPQY